MQSYPWVMSRFVWYKIIGKIYYLIFLKLVGTRKKNFLQNKFQNCSFQQLFLFILLCKYKFIFRWKCVKMISDICFLFIYLFYFIYNEILFDKFRYSSFIGFLFLLKTIQINCFVSYRKQCFIIFSLFSALFFTFTGNKKKSFDNKYLKYSFSYFFRWAMNESYFVIFNI